MCSIILIICVLIPFIRADGDETAAVVDEQYGVNMYCHFGYFGAADPDSMRDYFSQEAQKFGQAQLKGYKVGFTTYPDGTVVDTLLEDSNGVTCGMAYLVSVYDFQKTIKSTFDCNNQKVEKVITVTIDVTKDGKQISMPCNALQELIPPTGNEVPCKSRLQVGIDAYTAGQLPQDCIDKLRQIQTKDC